MPEILVHYNSEPIDSRYAQNQYIPPPSTIAPPVTTYRPYSLYATPSTPTATPIISSTNDAYVSSTTFATPTATPQVDIPSKYFLPPLDASPIVAINPVNQPTQIPVTVAAYTVEEINNELEAPSAISIKLPIALAPTISSNDISDSSPQYRERHISSTISPIAGFIATDRTPIVDSNVRPLFDRNTFYRNHPNSYQYYEPNQLDANTKQFDRYNAQLANSFSYFLPRQYHEERYDAQNRDGSFGYIDPFGIRRVVYYQTSPDGGLKIRKNNRYVGFNAKPYDSK